MRGVYLRRRAALLEGLDAHCANFLTVHNADAGLHIATLLRRHGSEVEVVRRLSGRGLVAAALSSCYIGRVREQGLLLGFGGTDETDLRRATRILGEVLRSARSR
jgi:GntR family transcriptional regulator/MocR family aminotransferase